MVEERIKVLEDKVRKLEEQAHPPRTFVTCEKCKQTIKEK